MRVEGNLFGVRSLRVTAHYARNAQAFSERIYRLAGVALVGSLRPLASLGSHRFATRLVQFTLRGMSRDRLDLLGEEYFNYVLRSRLRERGIQQIDQLLKAGRQVVLVSQELEHVIRPLAEHLKVGHLLTNRLEFRDDLATGRLLNPVIPPPSLSSRLSPDLLDAAKLRSHLEFLSAQQTLEHYVFPTERQVQPKRIPVVHFSKQSSPLKALSVRQALAGKSLLLIGSTGFIGKVWLCMLLQDLREIGRIHLLVRRHGARSALQRFEKIVAESPAFRVLHELHGDSLGEFLAERVEVLEGDLGEPHFGLDDNTAARLFSKLDWIVNSAGLTDFNPDLRLAMSTNADSALHLVSFLRKCDHAGLVQVSTCFVNGRTDGRVPEEVYPNYNPGDHPEFDAYSEWRLLQRAIERVNQEAEMPQRSDQFHKEARARRQGDEKPETDSPNLEGLVRKIRTRWVRDQLIELGIRRANSWGWPNIYTFTKSLGESLLLAEGKGLPIAIVRPSIVESSVKQPFRGWNEGVNTTAPLSYLLGTYFRQLPSNERKRLDVIPVDLVCRGLTLVSAAVVLRCHEKVYQLATSATNPANMRRTIELTGLAHRKHYRSLEGLEHWMRARCDTIPVSKTRYRNVSLPRFRTLLQGIQRILSTLAFEGEVLARKQRALDRVHKVIELYEPFILDNEYYFAADNIKVLARALPADEAGTFGYETDLIDWYDYWINLHVPALRRWTYPLIEGRRPETGLLARNFKLPVRTEHASVASPSSQPSLPGDSVLRVTRGSD